MTLSKHDRIELKKQSIGSKHERKLKKYSKGFEEIFTFFFKSYRSGLLDFCGSKVELHFKKDGPDCKECFRLFEDGRFKNIPITTKHPNIVKAIIIGKKSWGLWKNEWCDGIAEGSFTKYEILKDFEIRDIKIPNSLMEDFENTLCKKRCNFIERNSFLG